MLPLNYAVLNVLYQSDDSKCAKDVMRELQNEYGKRRPFKEGYVLEVLMSAAQNGLFDETGDSFDENRDFCTYFKCNDEGRKVIKRYIY